MIDLIARALEAPLRISHPLEPLDAIVVLGAPLRPSGALSTILEERVAAAAALYHAGGAPVVVASGGSTHAGSRAEADAIADELRAAGVPDVIAETRSRTTEENARYTAELLAARGARSVWIVTQPFHGRRSARLFRSAGFEPRVWHIENSVQYRDRRRAVKWMLREYAAWAKLAVSPGLRRR